MFGGSVIANEGLSLPIAESLIQERQADLVSFGKFYISNPDLAERLKAGHGLTEPDPATFYASGAHGYTDYTTFKR